MVESHCCVIEGEFLNPYVFLRWIAGVRSHTPCPRKRIHRPSWSLQLVYFETLWKVSTKMVCFNYILVGGTNEREQAIGASAARLPTRRRVQASFSQFEAIQFTSPRWTPQTADRSSRECVATWPRLLHTLFVFHENPTSRKTCVWGRRCRRKW